MYSEGERFLDDSGRTLLLRGISLGGSSKVPTFPPGAAHLRDHLFAHRTASFVGRPFSLEEADTHFARLRVWGFTLLRLLVTWEAIEHAGPGLYDEDYLDAIAALVRRAAAYELHVVIDPHQDVWSRFTGGDGAPGWTLEAVGLRLETLHAAGAAFLHQLHDGPFPRMIWPTNGSKLAAATMFTLFFAGDDFAPHTRVAGAPVQDYLQRHYCAAIAQLARRLCDCTNVVGYEVMNEPLHGYIGIPDLTQFDGPLRLGASPTPYQGMVLGAGYPVTVERWKMTLRGPHRAGHVPVNAAGAHAWREDAADIWRQHGVWEVGADGRACLLQPAYFARAAGRPVEFTQDYYRPFANRFAHAIREVHPGTALFIDAEIGHMPARWGPTMRAASSMRPTGTMA
jgi:hypothetical protein